MINSAVVVIQLYCAHFLQQQKKIHIFVVRLLKSTVYTVKSWSCHVFIWWSCDHSTRALVGFVLQITMWQRNNSTAVDIFMANILFISPFYAFVFYADTHFNTLCLENGFHYILFVRFVLPFFATLPECSLSFRSCEAIKRTNINPLYNILYCGEYVGDVPFALLLGLLHSHKTHRQLAIKSGAKRSMRILERAVTV